MKKIYGLITETSATNVTMTESITAVYTTTTDSRAILTNEIYEKTIDKENIIRALVNSNNPYKVGLYLLKLFKFNDKQQTVDIFKNIKSTSRIQQRTSL